MSGSVTETQPGGEPDEWTHLDDNDTAELDEQLRREDQAHRKRKQAEEQAHFERQQAIRKEAAERKRLSGTSSAASAVVAAAAIAAAGAAAPSAASGSGSVTMSAQSSASSNNSNSNNQSVSIGKVVHQTFFNFHSAPAPAPPRSHTTRRRAKDPAWKPVLKDCFLNRLSQSAWNKFFDSTKASHQAALRSSRKDLAEHADVRLDMNLSAEHNKHALSLLVQEIQLAIKQKPAIPLPTANDIESKLIVYFNSTKEKFKSADNGTLSPNRNQKAYRTRRQLKMADRAAVLQRKPDDLRQLFIQENPSLFKEMLGAGSDSTLWDDFVKNVVSDPVFHSDDEFDDQGRSVTCHLKWRSEALNELVKLFDRLHGTRAKVHNRVPKEPKRKLDTREMQYLSRPELAPAINSVMLRECMEEATIGTAAPADSEPPTSTQSKMSHRRATRPFDSTNPDGHADDVSDNSAHWADQGQH